MRKTLIILLLAAGTAGSCAAPQEQTPVSQAGGGSEQPLFAGCRVHPAVAGCDSGDQRGELIRLGYEVIVRTQEHAKPYVGNSLNCTNCHLDAGLDPNAMSYVGLSRVYPEYRARAGRMVSLADRVNECFERSLNGKPLPEDGHKMKAVLAYIEWLSSDVPKESRIGWRGLSRITSSRAPDPMNGKKLFAARCVFCHGADGQGTMVAPPLWGPGSFNIAAGMARVSVAASFIKANMPRTRGWALTDDEAYDVAAFITKQPRPDFAGKANDWPKGGKPADSPY
ncbi:MAG: c-type cytochrome [Nitrospiraceae bacterium]